MTEPIDEERLKEAFDELIKKYPEAREHVEFYYREKDFEKRSAEAREYNDGILKSMNRHILDYMERVPKTPGNTIGAGWWAKEHTGEYDVYVSWIAAPKNEPLEFERVGNLFLRAFGEREAD